MITVLGSIHVDFVVKVPRLPRPGETVLGHGFSIYPGGKGANQAVGCGRLGVRTYMVGKIGRSFRDMLVKNFVENNVDTRYVSFTDETETGVALIFVSDETGENMIAVDPGADYKLTIRDVDNAFHAIEDSRIFLTQLEIPVDIVEYSIRRASPVVEYVILNPAPARSISEEVLKFVDIITPNRTEAFMLTGIRVESVNDAVRAGRELVRKGVDVAVITMGSQGSVLVEKDYALFFPSFKVSAVDTTGAGDAFNAGLAYGLSKGYSIIESVKIANAVAAIKTTKPGAQTGLPWLRELEEFASSSQYLKYKPVEV
ncbi:ribokinase [Thermogladius sp. 4427co]|uniref:ribokinase n=1 Tax=Thermogladius sp. 4427co TaxID=3450718 RepID=UPI003F7A8D5F